VIDQRLAIGSEIIFRMEGLSGAATRGEGFEAIYGRHYHDLFRYCLAWLREVEEAEDLVGEVFERGFRAWREGRGPAGEALPWLLLIARRILIDRNRRRRLLRWLPLAGSDAARAPDQSQDADRLEFWLWFDRLAAVLTDRQREVLLLRYQLDLSDAQIGQAMGLSEAGVRSLAFRAIATLREHPELVR
jgi:RNA polymerase sigma-70 factor (ECF subfamily)